MSWGGLSGYMGLQSHSDFPAEQEPSPESAAGSPVCEELVPCLEKAGGLGAVGILGAWLCLVPAGWRLCCTFGVRGGTRPRYPMTDWEGAGAAEAPLGGSGLLSRCEAASRSLSSSKWL